MGKLIVQTDDQEIDRNLVSRLLLGAQSEHQQRLLAIRLLHHDPEFRVTLVSILEPFEMFDLDLVTEYAAVLERDRAVERERRRILAQAFGRATDLEGLIRGFTFRDVLSLGEITCKLFSWSMAEYLLERTRRTELSTYNVKTSLYLAQMVIDVVEILGAAGHSPEFPNVVRDVRQRIREAAEGIEEGNVP